MIRMSPMAEPSTTERAVCYRHPRVGPASAVSRANGRSARTASSRARSAPLSRVRRRADRRAQAVRRVSKAGQRAPTGIVTYTLIALNAVVFVAQLITAGDISGTSGEVFVNGALFGPLVADGEWWRLITAAFLHGGLLHLAFNMLFLWWFGRNLEAFVGPGRYLGIYIVSALAGSAGALLIAPDAPAVGASGAVFGILGAGLVLERGKGIAIFGGQALFVIVINLGLGFVLSNVSIGGHIGGLIGGALCMLALEHSGASARSSLARAPRASRRSSRSAS